MLDCVVWMLTSLLLSDEDLKDQNDDGLPLILLTKVHVG